jgi:hypothetical protein
LIDPIHPNPKWRPFILKREKDSSDELKEAPNNYPLDPEFYLTQDVAMQYKALPSPLNQIQPICSRSFEYMFEDGKVAAKPFRMIKKNLNRVRPEQDFCATIVSRLQGWT